MGQRRDFVLSGEHDARDANGVHEAEFFDFRKAFGEREFPVAIDARMGDGFIEGDFRRPLRNGIVALAALVEIEVCADDFVQHFRGTLDEQIGQARRGSSVDYGGAVFFFETLHVMKLFGAKGMAREVRA